MVIDINVHFQHKEVVMLRQRGFYTSRRTRECCTSLYCCQVYQQSLLLLGALVFIVGRCTSLCCLQVNQSLQLSGVRSDSVMWIRMNYYMDQDPEILHTNPDPVGSGSKEKLLTKFNFSKFCEKMDLLTGFHLYINLAKVARGRLRSQKSC